MVGKRGFEFSRSRIPERLLLPRRALAGASVTARQRRLPSVALAAGQATEKTKYNVLQGKIVDEAPDRPLLCTHEWAQLGNHPHSAEQDRVAAPREPAKPAAPTQRWLTVAQAARYMGMASPGGRAPTSTYEIAREIGSLVGNRWLIHSSDLDEWIRQQGRGRAA